MPQWFAAALTDLNELKAARLRGELVEASAVEAEWSDVLRIVRAGMLALPSRVAAAHYSRPSQSRARWSPSSGNQDR